MMIQTAFASDPSEKGVPTSPLSIYSGGLGLGAMRAINDSLKNQTKNSTFLKVSFINSVYLMENMSLFIDVDWLAPGLNFGTDFGFDIYATNTQFRPFIGAGLGVRYFDKEKVRFGDKFGPSGTVHAGVVFDVTEQLQMRFRMPYQITANETFDQTVGFDIGFLFSDKFRKVKKLNY